MALPLPTTLSPSKVSSFTDCALAFRFSSIDRLPEPPQPQLTRGTLVHLALQRLFELPAHERSAEAAMASLEAAVAELGDDPDLVGLGFDDAAMAAFVEEARTLVRRYLDLEDPRSVDAKGLEIRLTASVGDLRLVGIIDRLDLEDGEWVVTDYKTGKAPRDGFERSRLTGVHFYAFMLEKLFDIRPARVQLLYLADPVAVVATPTEQSVRGLERKLTALWSAITRAAANDDFRPRPSALCAYCSYAECCPEKNPGGHAEAYALRIAERDALAATAS